MIFMFRSSGEGEFVAADKARKELRLAGFLPYNVTGVLSRQPYTDCDSARMGHCWTLPMFCQFCSNCRGNKRYYWGAVCFTYSDDDFKSWRDRIGKHMMQEGYMWDTAGPAGIVRVGGPDV